MEVTQVKLVFGRETHAVTVDDRAGELTKALIERAKMKRKWWWPVNYELDGYIDPFASDPV